MGVNAHHEFIHTILDVVGQLPHLICPYINLVFSYRSLRHPLEDSLHALELGFQKHDLTPLACLQLVFIS